MKTKMRILSIVITIAMLVGMLPIYSVAADEYPTIMSGEAITATLDGDLKTAAIYKFVPEKDGNYVFYSYDNDYDTYGHLYDENMEEILTNDDTGEYYNFKIEAQLEAGTTYYVKGRFYNTTNSGSFQMAIAEAVPTEEIIIIYENDEPIDSIEVYQGKEVFLDSILKPRNSVSESFTWSVEGDAVSIDDSYDSYTYLYALNPGTATVTSTTGNGISDSVTVTVKEATEITVNSEHTVTHSNGRAGAPMFKFTPTETATYSVYTTNNVNANMDIEFSYIDNGELYFEYSKDYDIGNGDKRLDYEFEAGKTYFINASHGLEERATFTVRLIKPVPATGMGIAPNVHSGIYGTTLQLNPYFLPELNATSESVTYVSSADDIVSVDENGLATLHKPGEATITATSENGHNANCVITVTDIPAITAGQTETVHITVPEGFSIFKFIPEEDGLYFFESAGGLDTYGYILDADENELTYNDGGTDFSCSYELTAGTTYLLKARLYSKSSTGSFTVSVTKHEHSLTYEYEDEYHYSYCDECGLNNEENHSFEDGLCVCGYAEHDHVFKWYNLEGTEYHYTECAKCLLGFYFDHEFDENGECVCGYADHDHNMEIGGIIDEYWHETICRDCGIDGNESHEFDSDSKCECGYTYHIHSGENFYKSLYFHSGECDICGLFFEDSDHAFNEYGICSCGTINHDHDNKEYVDIGPDYHNVICTDCGVNTSSEDHYYDESDVCKYCGHVYSEIVYGNGIHIGDDTVLYDGEFLKADGTVTDTEPAEWVAHFKDMVLILQDININSEYAAIYYECAEEDLEIVIYGNVNITVKDDDGIYIDEGDLTISGTGTLTINVLGDYDGIDVSSIDDVTIEDSVTIIIDAVDSGIEANEKFIMNGGTLIISAGDEGIDTEDVEINGGVLIIKADSDSIDASYNIVINGGYLNLTAGSSGLEADENITINGGTIVIYADDYGIQAGIDPSYVDYSILTINSGYINISAGNAALCTLAPIVIAGDMGNVTMAQDVDGIYYSIDGEEILTDLVLPADADVEFTVSLSEDTEYYTGKDLTPAVTVTDKDGKALTAGTDYSVKWSATEIISAGIYTLTVSGMGDYEGYVIYKIFTVRDPVVYVGGVEMHSGDYLANGSDTITDKKPVGGYVYFKNGTLELNGFEYEGKGYEYDDGYTSVIYSYDDLNIVLKGNNTLDNTTNDSDCITSYGAINIKGSGTLTLKADYGIYCYDGLVTIDGGTINATNNHTAINAGTLTVNGGSLTLDTEFGVYAYTIEMNGGTIKATTDDTALYSENEIVINGGIININAPTGISGSIVNVNGGYVKINAIMKSIVAYDGYAENGISLGETMVIRDPENSIIKIVNGSHNIFDGDGLIATNVIISGENYGDANADGKINISDATIILKYLSKWDVLIDKFVSDTNGNGKVNISDVSYLLKYLAKWDVTLGKK